MTDYWACQTCGDEPADISACHLDYGDECDLCHLAGCRECQDGLAEQDAAEAASDGRWT